MPTHKPITEAQALAVALDHAEALEVYPLELRQRLAHVPRLAPMRLADLWVSLGSVVLLADARVRWWVGAGHRAAWVEFEDGAWRAYVRQDDGTHARLGPFGGVDPYVARDNATAAADARLVAGGWVLVGPPPPPDLSWLRARTIQPLPDGGCEYTYEGYPPTAEVVEAAGDWLRLQDPEARWTMSTASGGAGRVELLTQVRLEGVLWRTP